MKIAAIIFVAISVVEPLAAQDREPPAYGQFIGFAKGSWIICTTTTTNKNEVTTHRKKMILDSTDSETDGLFHDIVTIEEASGDFSSAGRRSALHIGSPIEAKREFELVESVDDHLLLGGKMIPCRRARYVSDPEDEDRECSVTQWTTDAFQIPYRVLVIDEVPGLGLSPNVIRIRVEIKSPEFDLTATFAVTDLAATIPIGDNILTCILEEGEIVYLEDETDRRTKIQRWLTDEVPGRIAKNMEIRTTGRRKFERIVTVDEYFIAK